MSQKGMVTTMKHTIFTGAGVAIATPMHADGSIYWEELGRLIDWQIEQSTDAIIICGTTGESATMSDQEHVDAIRFAVNHTAGRVPVIAGAGSNDTAYAIHMAQEAAACDADGILVVTPYYNKCSQTGLAKHFEMIADAAKLPMILYNVPSRTGVNIAIDTYKYLSGHPYIVAAKEASGNISHVADLKAACGDDLDVYSGNDDQIVPILSLGGKGVISVLSNVMPKETHDICQLYFDGKVAESAALQLKLLPLVHALFSDVNPIPVKEALNLIGFAAGECRMPLCSMSDAKKEALKAELQKLDLI